MNARTIRCMSWATLFAAVVSSWMAAACRDRDEPPRAPKTATSNTPWHVTGKEKIVWDEIASPSQIARYRFIVYIDDAPGEPIGATCGAAEANGVFPCSAALPKMPLGPHRLQLAVQETDEQKRQSLRSNAILLEVVTSKTPS